MIDTLEITKRLLKAKDNKAYAEEIAHILKEQQESNVDSLATKGDITNLKSDITNLRELLNIKFNYLMWAIGALSALNVGILFMLFDMIKSMPK